MKSIKPNNMALSFKVQVLNLKEVLSISAFATFSFNLNEPRLFDEQELWKTTDLNLAKDEILDFGAPKHRGEFLIYGACYSPEATRGIGVYVKVANISKTLVVMGQHSWTTFGVSETEYFKSMPINYSNAFGGEGYLPNPLGKGYATNANNQMELPNIVDPNYPITDKSDRPQPAGFTAYPIMWPQRMQYLGNLDDNYFVESWPHLPKGTNPEFFNSAPMDQRLTGFFKGNEEFTIKNMHHKNQTQNSRLPGVRARLFVVQKLENGEELFKELITKAETLWLFPNQEIGTLLYRGNTEVADEEYSDVNYLYAAWEQLSEDPKPIEFYFQQFNNEINLPQEVAVPPPDTTPTQKLIPEAIIETLEVPAVVEETPPPVNPQLDNALNELKELEAKLNVQLKSANIDIDAAKKNLLQKASSPMSPTTDLESMMKQLETNNANLMKKFNISADDKAKILAKSSPQTSPPPAQDIIAKLKASGVNNPEFEKSLTQLEQLNQSLAPKEEEKPEIKEVEDIEPPKQEPLPESILLAPPLTASDVLRKYKINKNLSNLDLSNLDLSKMNLSGANFENSILESTLFEESILNKSTFTNSRLNSANFTKASLRGAMFSESYAASATFNQADLSSIGIRNSDFSYCNFNKVNLKQAEWEQSNFESSDFTKSQAIQLMTTNCIFTNCNLSHANFSKSTLSQADLSNANLDQTDLTSIFAPELKLFGATGSKTCFKSANLDNSRADETTKLTKANFNAASISTATWEGIQLLDSNLTSTMLDDSNFSSCIFNNVTLELSSAKNANFSKAQLTKCDLNRIDLFKGSLRRAVLSEVDLRYSNLFGVDFYRAKLINTDLNGANLKKTLLLIQP